MRLKTLFFPIILVISVSIFIGYIWPEITRLRSANEIKLKMDQQLQEIDVKKGAAESVGKQISSSDSEKTIKDYLPENKIEERIINDVNFLASGSNVALVDISLESEKTVSDSKTAAPVGVAGILNPIARADAVANEEQPIDELTAGKAVGSATRSTSAMISISGEYDKIRVFLNGLHRLPIFSTVKSLVITKQQTEKSEGESSSSENILLANVDVDFGYMNVSKVSGQEVAKFNPENIDNEIVDVLKKYTSQKAPSLEIDGGAKGKSNPFNSN
ncbi:MAG: hypothetical protein ACD_67C00088G0001 [uncultured bacterium]|nr:MAG: hypothetical protein ACD_67C00088G0001 [uncultured bacterium]